MASAAKWNASRYVASNESLNAVVNDILRACVATSFSKDINSGSS
jgi:hypothetical protein